MVFGWGIVMATDIVHIMSNCTDVRTVLASCQLEGGVVLACRNSIIYTSTNGGNATIK